MSEKSGFKKIDTALEIGRSGPTHYEVFARADAGAQLEHIGSVEAPNEKLAKARAWYLFDHISWQQMIIVPSAAIVQIHPARNYLELGA
ncbi:hypothetical protein G6L89_025160 (plasmid) [Agrobacterium fabrum]|uniref:hypothetical protein n=1 Tax=Agrobacterium fabrum TaxID=1176649 RepID=UPI0015736486|nr:hypothetical protein [Agrobacterium fabrum]NTB10509.1 hypothetical protein [Agrobacterium fabrum]